MSVLAHLIDRVSQDIAQLLGTLWRLGGVLANVLHDGPQVQAGAPVDITHVGQHDVGFVAAGQGIVAWELCVPLAFSVALVH